MELRFAIPGDPRPLARHRTRVVSGGGRAYAQQYQPKENRIALATVQQYALAAKAKAGVSGLIEGPVEVRIVFYRLQPESKRITARTKVQGLKLMERLWPTTKPDVDNLGKLILDGCNKVVWRDDAQVCRKLMEKRWTTESPRTLVMIRALGKEESNLWQEATT